MPSSEAVRACGWSSFQASPTSQVTQAVSARSRARLPAKASTCSRSRLASRQGRAPVSEQQPLTTHCAL
eukprot:10741751-Alexandrium_andersonii.AAC.2